MRHAVALAAGIACATVAFSAAPSLALERPAKPLSGAALVTRVADLDRPVARPRKHHRKVVRGRDPWGYRYYRYRPIRPLYYEMEHAGYPAPRVSPNIYVVAGPTYYPAPVYYAVPVAYPVPVYGYYWGRGCCGYDRHW